MELSGNIENSMGEAHTHLQLQACSDSQPPCSSPSQPTQSSASLVFPHSHSRTRATCSSESSSAHHHGLQLRVRARANSSNLVDRERNAACVLCCFEPLLQVHIYILCIFIKRLVRQECNHHPHPVCTELIWREASGHFLTSPRLHLLSLLRLSRLRLSLILQ